MFGSHDSREPPQAPQSIPFVGHIIGLSKSKFNYYVDLSQQTNSPIFTMYMPGQKMYIITDPDLVQKVQKQHKILAFPPIEAKFANQICGTSPEAQAILAKNVNGDDGDHGLSMESYISMRENLKPGAALDDMNRIMIKEIASSLDELQPAKGTSKKIGLNTWLRDAVTSATTRSVYGPMNPYDNKEIADAFWTYAGGMMTILVGVMPWLLARKPIAARDKVAKAFEEYYKAGGQNKASGLTKGRYQVSADNGVSIADIARYEVGGSNAVLMNTAPAVFWTLFFINAHPGLLEDVRKEIDACTETTTENGVVTKSLDVATLKENCPLLLSAYQEVLRYCTIGTSVREVVEDTYLEGFLLKKGAMIQMPSRIIHQNADLWGSGVADFNPRRFLPEERKNRPKDVCFRSFGGGKTLCPGRHFATNEVIAAVAVFVARMDVTPTAGEWKEPTAFNSNVTSVVMEPDHDIDVELSLRPGFEDVKWSIGLDKADKIFSMVTEDFEQLEE